MPLSMKAKLYINSITPGELSETLHMSAVGKSSAYPEDGSDENNTFARFTPSADVEMLITNPDLMGKYKVDQHFIVDFTPVDS